MPMLPVVAGRVPFTSKSLLEVLNWATKGARPSLHALRPDLPKDIDVWVQKVLAADPDQRYQSIAAAWSSLEGLFPSASRPPI